MVATVLAIGSAWNCSGVNLAVRVLRCVSYKCAARIQGALYHAAVPTPLLRSSSYLRITSRGSVYPTSMPTALATSRRTSHSSEASATVGTVLGQPSVYRSEEH